MTHLRVLVQDEPLATPYEGKTVTVALAADGSTVRSPLTDEAGFAEWRDSLNPGPVRFLVEGKAWDSRDAFSAGPVVFSDIPAALFDLEGVISGYRDALRVSQSGTAQVSIAPGAAVLAGHPVVLYDPYPMPIHRPTVSTRVDRLVLRLTPTTGQASVQWKHGVEGGAEGTVETTAVTWELSLAKLTVLTSGNFSITDERVFATQLPDVARVLKSDLVTTTSTGGAAIPELSTTLSLPRDAVYDLTAEVSALQGVTTAQWVKLATYGPSMNGLNMSSMIGSQIATDVAGNVYIADTGNARVVLMSPTGAYLGTSGTATGVTGVTVAPDGSIIICYLIGSQAWLGKLSGWGTLIGSLAVRGRHLTNDGTYVYVTLANDTFAKYRLSDGVLIGVFGSTGTGNGQFKNPIGIAANPAGTVVYVVDSDNGRIQTFTTAGAYLGQLIGLPPFLYGIAFQNAGNIVVADGGNHVLRRYTTGGFAHPTIPASNPNGVAVGPGEILWATDAIACTVSKWDEALGGYGEVAIGINGTPGPYLGIGNRTGEVGNAHGGSLTGPTSATVAVFGKALIGTLTLQQAVLNVRAVPRR